MSKLREASYDKIVKGAMLAFAPAGHPEDAPYVGEDQQWYVWDAMKHGLETDLMRAFKGDASAKRTEFAKRIVFSHIDVDSLNQRRNQTATNVKTKSCVEYLHVITFDDLENVKEARLEHYNTCTNKMDFLGPVKLEPLTSSESWNMAIKVLSPL